MIKKEGVFINFKDSDGSITEALNEILEIKREQNPFGFTSRSEILRMAIMAGIPVIRQQLKPQRLEDKQTRGTLRKS